MPLLGNDSRLILHARRILQTVQSGDSSQGSNRRGRILSYLHSTIFHAFAVGKVGVIEISK